MKTAKSIILTIMVIAALCVLSAPASWAHGPRYAHRGAVARTYSAPPIYRGPGMYVYGYPLYDAYAYVSDYVAWELLRNRVRHVRPWRY